MKRKSEKSILVAFDRDNTLIYDDGYFGKDDNWREKIRFYEGAVDTIKAVNNLADVIVATNQIGVALGLYGPERVEEINKHIDSLLKKKGAKIDGWYFCPYVEKSWAQKKGLDLNSPWVLEGFPENRKPRIGMLETAAADLGKNLSFYKKIFVIGDSLDDINLALNVDGIGIFFKNKKNEDLLREVESLRSLNPDKVFYVDNLISAIKIIESIIKK